MMNKNWCPESSTQEGGGSGGGGEAPTAVDVDWRAELPPGSRDKIVDKIVETLKKCIPVSGPKELCELKKIAVRFEEEIYHVASAQSDYLERILKKMLAMETKSQNTIPSAMTSNSNVSINKPSDTSMQPQKSNPGQQMPKQLASQQSQTRQQLLVQNMQNNALHGGGQVSGCLSSTLLPVTGLNQFPLPTVVRQSTNMGVSQNSLGNTMGQGLNPNLLVNPPRQMQSGQSTTQQQPHQSQNSQQCIHQQQLHPQILKQKFQQQGNIQQSLVSSHLLQQQLQQNMLQPTQIQPTKQSVLQGSVIQPSSVQLAAIPGPQQNQQTSVQHPAQSMLQHQVMRHQQQPQPQAIHRQQTDLSQQPMLISQPLQYHQLESHQPPQQSQFNSQQNTMGDLQPQPQQQLQSRLPNQQSNLSNFQQPQLLTQQINLSNVNQHPLAPQSNISGLHQQQQLLGPQLGISGLQVGQLEGYLCQQSKSQVQQQMQSGGTNSLPQGQQSQPTAVQQQLISQMQQSPGQLQTQVCMQQTVGLPQQANQLQHDAQQKLQAPSYSLQQQNAIDQQNQLYQSQRNLTETSSSSQAGNANAVDWREETYQKLQVMKERYLPDLTEMLQKIMLKLQQHNSLPQQPKSGQIDKLKMFLGHVIAFLQVPKSDISTTLKERMGSIEKQILGVLNTHRPRKSTSLQPEQLPRHHMQLLQSQQSQPQIAKTQSRENQINPQLPQMNIQGSVATMQQVNVVNLQYNSLSSTSGVSSAHQNMMNSLQSNSGIESGQGNAMGSSTRVSVGSMPQNSLSALPQVNIGTMSHQSGLNVLQSNVNGHQPNSYMFQQQQLKQQQEQQMLQMQQRQMRQRHVQQQQLLPQHLQQQQFSSQLLAHQMAPLHQISDGNDIKIRPGMVVKQGVFPPASQRMNYVQQQLKPGTSFPSSSPQLLQEASPQIPLHSSPQIDQQNMLPSLNRVGTPSQSSNSPFVVPSPSTPLALSPMPGELEKPNSAVSSLLSVGTSVLSHVAAPSLSIGTPGISASPLLAEFSCLDGAHGNATAAVSIESTVTEQPIERLMTAVKALSPQALIAGVHDIGSVVGMVDRIVGSAPGNGSRAAVGEDLVVMTQCRLRAENFTTQDGASWSRKLKRFTSAMPLSIVSSTGSVEDDFLHFIGMESSNLESTATSAVKRPRTEANHVLLEEIRYINERLIDTVVEISNEEIDPSATAAVAEGGGVIVKCSYNAISLSPDFRTLYESAPMSRIQALYLLVPTNYPNCSPLLLDQLPGEVRKEYGDLSAKTKTRFSISLRNLSQPISLKEIARTWDECARGVILEYAQQLGGGSFSSKYGTWESCWTAA